MEESQNLSTPILVVDDLLSARKIVTRMLAMLGFNNFSEASSSKEAFDALRGKEFKIVITDLHLKDGLGTDLIAKVNTDLPSKAKEISFIIITSDMDKNSFQQAIKSGITSYLLKPFSPQLLSDRIGACLKKQ